MPQITFDSILKALTPANPVSQSVALALTPANPISQAIAVSLTPANPIVQDAINNSVSAVEATTKKAAEIQQNIQNGINEFGNNVQAGINTIGDNVQNGINSIGNNVQAGINENLWKVGLFAAAVLIIGGGVFAGGRQVGRAIGEKL